MRAVMALLDRRRLGVHFDLVEGKEESYFFGEFMSGSIRLKIYIYVDEAGFFVDEEWRIYETQDYDDSKGLIASFIRDLEAAIEGKSY
jgi:hypothetical protein